MTTTREPRGKLDTTASAVMNGPEDALDWLSIDWRQVEKDVVRLRQWIFTASRDGTTRGSATCRS
jgi:hypothetical protein